MLLMSFIFHMDTSLSHHFLLLFNRLELKVWIFDALLRRSLNVHIHIHTMLIEFWMLIVHTLHGQYDDLQGSDDLQEPMARTSLIFGYNFYFEVELYHSFLCCIANIHCSTCLIYDIICFVEYISITIVFTTSIWTNYICNNLKGICNSLC